MSDLGPPLPASLPLPKPGTDGAPTAPAPSPARPAAPLPSPAGPSSATTLSPEARAALLAQQAPAPSPAPPAPPAPLPPVVEAPAPPPSAAPPPTVPGLTPALVEAVVAATDLSPRQARAWLDALGMAHQLRLATQETARAGAPEQAAETIGSAQTWLRRTQDAVRRLLRLGALRRTGEDTDLERLLRRWLARSAEPTPLPLQLPLLDQLTRGLEAGAVARGAALADLGELRGLESQPVSFGWPQPGGPLARGLLNLALFLLPLVALGLAWVLLRGR